MSRPSVAVFVASGPEAWMAGRLDSARGLRQLGNSVMPAKLSHSAIVELAPFSAVESLCRSSVDCCVDYKSGQDRA